MLIQDLDKHERPSLMHYIDQFIREEQGAIFSAFTEEDVNRIVHRLTKHYSIKIKSYPKLTESFKDNRFILDVKSRVRQSLNNRPPQELVNEYEVLCNKYGLPVKKTAINKSNIEARIKKITETNGRSQDI